MQIRNFGPTFVKQLSIGIAIPLVYIVPHTHVRYSLIDFNQIVVKGSYMGRELMVRWSQNDKILTQNQRSDGQAIENLQGMEYDTVKVGLEYELSGNNNNDPLNQDDSHIHRRRRFARQESFHKFNQYTQRTTHLHDVSRARRSVPEEIDHIFQNLPYNRSLLFDCDIDNGHYCVTGTFDVNNFRVNDFPIKIDISFSVDLTKVGKL